FLLDGPLEHDLQTRPDVAAAHGTTRARRPGPGDHPREDVLRVAVASRRASCDGIEGHLGADQVSARPEIVGHAVSSIRKPEAAVGDEWHIGSTRRDHLKCLGPTWKGMRL